LSSVGAILSASNSLSRFCRGSPCCGGLGRFSGAGGSISLGGSPVGGSSGATCANAGTTANAASAVNNTRASNSPPTVQSLAGLRGCARVLFYPPWRFFGHRIVRCRGRDVSSLPGAAPPYSPPERKHVPEAKQGNSGRPGERGPGRRRLKRPCAGHIG